MKLGLRDAARVLTATMFVASAAAGCNFIVGVGDYSVGDAQGTEMPDATQGGDDGSLQGMDARSEPATETGPGADVRDSSVDRADVTVDGARADGTTEGGGDAEAGGGQPDGGVDANPDVTGNDAGDASDSSGGADASDGGPATGCGSAIPNTTAFQNLVATCVYVASCDPDFVPDSISDCITNDTLHAPGQNNPISCIANITSCAGYYACEGIRGATLAECPTFDGYCSGNVAFNCDLDPSVTPLAGTVTNCGAIPGGTCIQFSTTTPTVGIEADCVVQSGCTVPASSAPECIGNELSFDGCETSPVGGANVVLGRSCGNASCTALGNGSCTFETTGLCETEITSTCVAGSVMQACGSPAQTFNYNCATAGGTCQQVTGNKAECVSPGCSPAACTESCDGNHTISVCVGGAPFTIDCTAYNFTTCGQTTGSTTTPSIAYCL